MIKVDISSRILANISPRSKPYSIGDSSEKVFAVIINQSGSIEFAAEVKFRGRSKRKSIGEYPLISLSEARKEALVSNGKMKLGQTTIAIKQRTSEGGLAGYL